MPKQKEQEYCSRCRTQTREVRHHVYLNTFTTSLDRYISVLYSDILDSLRFREKKKNLIFVSKTRMEDVKVTTKDKV